MIANTHPNYYMIYAGPWKTASQHCVIGHELCCDILLIQAHRIKKKEYTLTIGLPLLIFFFQEGLVEEKGRNAFVFTGKYMYIS